jgi:phosphoglycolate phosphatase
VTRAHPSIVLFDLDGTLSDSAGSILTSLRHAFEHCGLPPLDPAVERTVLGPPFAEVLPPFLNGVPVARVTAAYRAHYDAGGRLDTSCYSGIPDLLGELRERGVRMAIATSKPEHSAVPIVEHLGLREYFETVGGDTPDGSRGSKALVIADVLRRLGSPDPSTVLMVGDRSHDVLGARAHALACAGAGWGYGLPGELGDAGADPVLATPAELARFLAAMPALTR